ncbi:hypothetical protein B0H12DRAFT_755213 [Mycena haematopus]|nr:hypothetical protein B0H12DRAFT_755213 [Mycena haematopus]
MRWGACTAGTPHPRRRAVVPPFPIRASVLLRYTAAPRRGDVDARERPQAHGWVPVFSLPPCPLPSPFLCASFPRAPDARICLSPPRCIRRRGVGVRTLCAARRLSLTSSNPHQPHVVPSLSIGASPSSSHRIATSSSSSWRVGVRRSGVQRRTTGQPRPPRSLRPVARGRCVPPGRCASASTPGWADSPHDEEARRRERSGRIGGGELCILLISVVRLREVERHRSAP